MKNCIRTYIQRIMHRAALVLIITQIIQDMGIMVITIKIPERNGGNFGNKYKAWGRFLNKEY